jgi:hypothetical protein
MKESLIGFLSDVVRQVLGGGAGRDRCSEKSAATYLPAQILLDVACSFPPYIDFCYNPTLFDLYFLLLLPGSHKLVLGTYVCIIVFFVNGFLR